MTGAIHTPSMSSALPVTPDEIATVRIEASEAGRYDVICTPIPYTNRDGSQVRLLVRPQ